MNAQSESAAPAPAATAENVALLTSQRDEARAHAAWLSNRLNELTGAPGVFTAGEYQRVTAPLPEPAASVPPRLRPGDQPLPVPNEGPSMHDLVIEDLDRWPASRAEAEAVKALMLERKRIGFERYKSLLQAGNGRDWHRDLAEELADAAAYARLGLEETGDCGPDDALGGTYDRILSALFWLQNVPGARS